MIKKLFLGYASSTLRYSLLGSATLLLVSSASPATTFNFDSDPFAGTTVRGSPGRQVVGGEAYINFNPATDVFAVDGSAFGMVSLRTANGLANTLPDGSINVVVLENTDDDGDPLSPFGASNAANLIAPHITQPGPGLFIYFNQSLHLPQLVYSSDLSSQDADLKILARLLNLYGPAGYNSLPAFSQTNFRLVQPTPVPEPSSPATVLTALFLLLFGIWARHTWDACGLSKAKSIGGVWTGIVSGHILSFGGTENYAAQNVSRTQEMEILNQNPKDTFDSREGLTS